jgi:Rps23 Pro-64 3,4-dihydroxylase Tpa1-like proline 4-hydroxylase
VIAAVERISGKCAPLIGTTPKDWAGITAQSYLYPAGSGLSWHKDSTDRSGAYIYYAHPYWNVTFGGELLIAERVAGGRSAAGRRPGQQVGPHLDNEAENRALLALGVGSFVHAKPNRLVVLRGGTPHMIRAVTAAAGNHVRCSIAGFMPTATSPT